MTTGTQLKLWGQDDVLAADHAIHRGAGDHIRAAIHTLADTGRTFTADDVRERLPDDLEPHSPNLMPAIFGSEARAKRIVRVGLTHSTRTERRDGLITIWQGATT